MQDNSSITVAQINLNIACNLLGNAVIALLFVGTLIWFKLWSAAVSGALVAAGWALAGAGAEHSHEGLR